jgi:two-component system, LuxR family, sensor kinase FixL
MPYRDTQWLRVVVDTAVDGVLLVDAKERILVFNPACERLFGYASQEAVGREAGMLIDAPLHDGTDTHPDAGQRRIVGVGREVMGRRKDGSAFPLELSVGETNRGGEPLYVGILHDITERKQLEEQRRLFTEHLLAISEERGHFSHVASHDMQEHLRMVLAFNGLLVDQYGPGLDDKARQYLSLSLHAAQQMRELVDDLVEYDRAGEQMQNAGPFDAQAEIEAVLEGLKDSIQVTDADISVDPLPYLPGNPVRFRRLMQNLLVNAIKYVAPRTRPQVHVRVDDSGEFWRFSVSDNGIGIDVAYFGKIFEPFKRLHAKARYVGSGLGLAICEKIVAGFGGRIWVESQLGAGSSFYFTIPKQERLQ